MKPAIGRMDTDIPNEAVKSLEMMPSKLNNFFTEPRRGSKYDSMKPSNYSKNWSHSTRE